MGVGRASAGVEDVAELGGVMAADGGCEDGDAWENFIQFLVRHVGGHHVDQWVELVGVVRNLLYFGVGVDLVHGIDGSFIGCRVVIGRSVIHGVRSVSWILR